MKELLFLALLFVTTPIIGQNEYRLGDKLAQQAIHFISFDKMDGQEITWDLFFILFTGQQSHWF